MSELSYLEKLLDGLRLSGNPWGYFYKDIMEEP